MNFSLSRSVINTWTDDRRLFNDGRYANPPAGGLRVSWESVTRVGSLDSNSFPMGEGRGGAPVHPQRERCQLVGPASMASFNKEHTH